MPTVLGIDPGTHRLGWGVVSGTPTRTLLVGCGCIELPSGTGKPEYLLKIHAEIENLLTKYQPERVGIEALFAQKNLKTVTSVAEARGVILYTFATHGLAWSEYSPNTIKAFVTGAGNANKVDVQRMVGLLLKIDSLQLLDDTTDALAVALTAQSIKS